MANKFSIETMSKLFWTSKIESVRTPSADTGRFNVSMSSLNMSISLSIMIQSWKFFFSPSQKLNELSISYKKVLWLKEYNPFNSPKWRNIFIDSKVTQLAHKLAIVNWEWDVTLGQDNANIRLSKYLEVPQNSPSTASLKTYEGSIIRVEWDIKMQKTHACCTTLQSNIRLILLSHGSLTKAEEKVTVSIGDKKKREREKSEKLKRNRGQFLQGQKRKKEKPVAQRQEIVIGTFALV